MMMVVSRKLMVEVSGDQEGLTSILIKNSMISKNFTNIY